MHEFGVMSYLLQAVQQKAMEMNATRVVAINLVIGDRSCIVDDSLMYYFDMMAEGTLAEGATLSTRRVPTQFLCNTCNKTYEPVEYDFCCPDCKRVGHITDEGSEFLIESILIERA
jgi:hydrogenase nickel incorporation protein HypA/HybF